MGRFRSVRAWILPLIAAVVSITVLGATLLLRYLDLDTYKARIVAQVKSALNRDLTYASGNFSFHYGPCFSFVDVTIKEKDGTTDFVKANRLTFNISLFPLLHRHLVLSRMQLDHPAVNLARYRDGTFNVSDLLAPKPGAAPAPGIRGIELNKARITFSDAMAGEKPLTTELSQTDLYLSRLVRGKSCDVKLDGFLGSGAGKVPLFAAGTVKLPAAGAPLTDTEISGRIKTGAVDAGRFWPYYGSYLPFKSLAGQLASEVSFRGKLNRFKAEASFKITGLNLDYPQVFHARLTPRTVKAACKVELTDRLLDFTGVKLNVDGLNVLGSCRLSDLHARDPRITAKATTGRFDLRAFRPYVPYGIIVKETADFIEQKIPAGFYQLDQGRLDGRVSQILHMERGQNYNVLSVKARVEDGVVNYGSGIPQFSGIKGELEIAGKDFLLKGMSARFGSSPFKLDGTIADYVLDVPTRYLFTASVQPRLPEAVWLLGHGRGGKLSLQEGASLKLTGEGTSALYRLSGDCDLTPVAYSYPELIVKPKGRANTLSFSGSFDKEAFRLASLSYHLAPLSLSATAVNRYRGGLSAEVRTNQFPMHEVASLLPPARKYQPGGKLQAQLHGEGASAEQMAWGGTLALAGASLKLTEKMKPLSGINGSVHIGADSVESPQLSLKIGNSAVSGKGTLSGFKNPSFTLSFASPQLDFGDLGLYRGRPPLHADNVQGTLSYGKERLLISSLSGTLGKSTLHVKGSMQDPKNPVLDLTVHAPHLELDDLLPLCGAPAGGGRLTVKAHLFAADGRFKDLPFQKLKGTMLLEDHSLQLSPVEFRSLDGEVSGRLRVDFGQGASRYQLNVSAQKVAADKLLRVLGVKKQELTGALSMQADLSAKGDGTAEWRRSAQGTVKLKVEHGSIRKFATLSKVFSILNVSQLLKFQLPDMVNGGMPYNKITGDLNVHDGVVSSQNLFIDSDAINVSTVGKLDLVKEDVDLVIGVQPLQTVDKVVSRIPIVGWILTGKDRSLISTYFEAKGPIMDPKVTAVPVKSLAKGVFNIFKRVFELPVRLVTDTGEVIVNK